MNYVAIANENINIVKIAAEMRIKLSCKDHPIFFNY